MQWYVTVSGQTSASTSNTNSLSLPNGTYSYSISPIGGHYYASTLSGTFTVDGNLNLPKWMNGALQINVTYYYGYTVTFKAQLLPLYVPWSVTLNGTTNSTTGSSSTITFLIKNGTYNYTVNIAPDWKIISHANGTLTMNGAPVTIYVSFSERYFRVTFIEMGLPAGTPWLLTVNGAPYTTTNGTLIFSEHNGTLDYIAGTYPGYTAKPSSGAVIIGYSNIVITIVYSPTTTVKSGTGNSTGGGFSLPSMSSIISFFHTATGMLTIVILVIVLIGLVVVAETRGHENKGKSKGNHSKQKITMK